MQLTKQLRVASAPFAHFLGVDSTTRDVALISGNTTKGHELPTASAMRPSALPGKARQDQIVSRRVAAGVTVQSSATHASRPVATVRVSKSLSKTPFADAMGGYIPPSVPASMATPAATLTDRQKIAASTADARAASQRVDALRKELSDKVWNATLSGKRANPTELDRLHRQIERAEATHKQLGKEATETEQRILARKSSAVRAVLSFSEEA